MRKAPMCVVRFAESGVEWWMVLCVALLILWVLLRFIPVRPLGGFCAFALVGVLTGVAGEVLVARVMARSDEGSVATRTPDLPNFYYIVLDGYAGLRGFPSVIPGAAEYAATLLKDFRRAGFEVREGAYASYFWTERSLYSILDNRLHASPPQLGKGIYRIPENRFFTEMLARGYHFRVYQSDHVDFCTAAQATSDNCITYRANDLSYDIRASEKYPLLLESLASRLSESYVLKQKRRFLGTASAIGAFDQLIADIPLHPKNTLVFAHLLVPHEPFVLDGSCNVRQADIWESTYTWYYGKLTEAESFRRWPLYLEQLQCVQNRVNRFMAALREAGLFEQSTIVIHSDHGSRIGFEGTFGPRDRAVSVSRRNFLDFYSALFALKRGALPLAPIPPESANSWMPLSHLISDLMGWPRAVRVQFLYRDVPTKPLRPPPGVLVSQRVRR